MKKDPFEMSVSELETHVAALKDDLEEVKDEKAFLQRLAKVQVPGHQIERYEVEIERLERKLAEAEELLAQRVRGTD